MVLGRGSLAEQTRAQAAVQLWQAKRAPVILTTGRGEAARLSAHITQLGVPLRAQLIEPNARTTEENAVRSFDLLHTIGVNRLILITDQPHMLRSVLTFQSFGFQVIPHPVTISPSLPAIEETALALREYVGLVSYALIGRFQPRTVSVAVLETPLINWRTGTARQISSQLP
ncbi:MAG: YdcF family protein [Leptolyngbya sp. SIO4C1]|nr:YdcF family protein [Leptolyngbya sp. SIO4C1]